MIPSCMNCGAMLMQGATICPVCRQPVAPAQGGSGWQQQPGPPTRPAWQQPGPPPLGPANSSSKAILFIVIGIAVLVMVGAVSGLILFSSTRRSSRDDESYNYNRSPRVSSTPSIYDANSEPPPAPTPPGARNRNSPKAPISGGVLNGKAISLPKPAYPAIAKAAHASGTVTVQVTVDEDGKVISASAVSGHPLLQQAAVQAARQARFSPTLLSGQPVKITGVLTYNFVAE